MDLDYPSPAWVNRLNGSLFSSANGYAGPGANTGNNIYSILSYAGWLTNWITVAKHSLQNRTCGHTPTTGKPGSRQIRLTPTTSFISATNVQTQANQLPAQVNTWAGWIKANPGVGQTLKSFTTVSFDVAASQEPLVDYVADTAMGNSTVYANAVASIRSHQGSKIFMYNPSRPYAGSFTTEDDGVALRELAWAQYKMGVDRYFYWESTYYNDFQNGPAVQNNVFSVAETFGGAIHTQDPVLGEWNYLHTNGEGVLFYPGTDLTFQAILTMCWACSRACD